MTLVIFYLQVFASDNDKDINKVTYTIVSGNDDGNFSINSSTGEIVLSKPLDRESTHQIILSVRAEDSKLKENKYLFFLRLGGTVLIAQRKCLFLDHGNNLNLQVYRCQDLDLNIK